MKNIILRFFLTLSAMSFFVIIYLIHNHIFPSVHCLIVESSYLFYSIYLIVPFCLTFCSIQISKKLSIDTIKSVNSVETSNNDFLSNYLAFFFVALSISNNLEFTIVFLMTLVFTFYSRVSYFNPVLLIFGYNFYYITTNENVKVMLISKEKLKQPNAIGEMRVHRINDYTFIGVEKDDNINCQDEEGTE